MACVQALTELNLHKLLLEVVKYYGNVNINRFAIKKFNEKVI